MGGLLAKANVNAAVHREAVVANAEGTVDIQGNGIVQPGAFAGTALAAVQRNGLIYPGALTANGISTVYDNGVIHRGAFSDMFTINFSNGAASVVAILLALHLDDPSGNVRYGMALFLYAFILVLFVAGLALSYFLVMDNDKSHDKTEIIPVKLNAPTRLVFVGNPGVGKSTLLNGLCGKPAFESGVTSGEPSLTTESKSETDNDGNVFIDTPGMSDNRTPDKAAKEITMAIRDNASFGNLKLFFVLTLDNGRVRATDTTTIKLVLDTLPANTPYGIIVNQIGPKSLQKLNSDRKNFEKLVVTLNQGRENQTTDIHLIEKDENLEEMDNAVVTNNPLAVFINSLCSCDAIFNVSDVVSTEEAVKKDIEILVRVLEDNDEKFRKDILILAETLEDNDEKFRNEVEKVESKANLELESLRKETEDYEIYKWYAQYAGRGCRVHPQGLVNPWRKQG